MERPNPDGHQQPLFKVRVFDTTKGNAGARCSACGRTRGFRLKKDAELWASTHKCYADE